MKIERTGSLAANYHKFLAYGQSGVGKTFNVQYLDNPIILSSENGLASLASQDIPFITIANMADMRESYQWFKAGSESSQYKTIVFDSLSEVTDICLNAEKALVKDPRAAYMVMQDKIVSLVRAYRDLPYNLFCICRIERTQDELGHIHFGPSVPGQKLGPLLPYFFDYVLAFRSIREDGATKLFIQTAGDDSFVAKDRSGLLSEIEPDMQSIITKLNGVKTND